MGHPVNEIAEKYGQIRLVLLQKTKKSKSYETARSLKTWKWVFQLECHMQIKICDRIRHETLHFFDKYDVIFNRIQMLQLTT